MRVTFENVESFELNVYALGQKKKGTTVEVCFGILSCSVLQNIQSNRRGAKKKRKMKLSPIFLYLLHFCALSNTRQRTICKLAQWNSLLKHLDLLESGKCLKFSGKLEPCIKVSLVSSLNKIKDWYIHVGSSMMKYERLLIICDCFTLKSLINEQGGLVLRITLKRACSFIRD